MERTLHQHGQAAVVSALVRSVEVADQVGAGDLSQGWRLLREGGGTVGEVLSVDKVLLDLALYGSGLLGWLVA